MNSKTIVRNTAWYGLETVISFGSSLITSILIARAMGPERMSFIVYVTWIVTITSSLGSVGLPATTRKYMAEFIGSGHRSTARSIYRRTLMLQALLASLATTIAVIWVLHDSPAQYRLAALLLVASTWPAMVNFVSAQANTATESLANNVPASVASSLTFLVMAVMTAVLNWGVTGVAWAMFSMRAVDFLVRLFPTYRRIAKWKSADSAEPPDLSRRMRRFAFQSVLGMLLTLVVWDRSEVFLLKHLSPDIRQISFYSVALGLAERLLIVPSIFAAASGVSILAQYGRDRSRLPAMTASSLRYLVLASVPVHIVATALVAPALLALYGHKWEGALLVATFSPLLCLPKAFLGPIQSLFESTDQQNYFLTATVVASFVDVGVAWWLIPRLGALGACIGSGVAQGLAVGSLWAIGVARYDIRLPWRFFAKLTAISAVSGMLAYGVARSLPPVLAVICGAGVAILSFFVLNFIFGILEEEDLSRLRVFAGMCPRPLARPVNLILSLLGRRAQSAPAAAEPLSRAES